MIDTGLIDIVREAQTPAGAFASTVHLYDRAIPDDNCFVTALVLRELAGMPEREHMRPIIDRALDFLLRCESPERPGAFHFYPPSDHPDWIGARLAPDADDTALATLMLVEYGRWPVDRIQVALREILDPFRLHYRPPRAKPWVRAGVWMTWLENPHLTLTNVVDCCVNVNVLALLHAAGWVDHPAYRAICRMVDAGVQMAGSSGVNARLLVPYYPHPAELYLAIQHAARRGATALRDILTCLGRYPWATVDRDQGWPAHRPVCGSLDGRITWTSEGLQAVRGLSHPKP